MTMNTAKTITTNAQVLDPVCGMTIDSAEAAIRSEAKRSSKEPVKIEEAIHVRENFAFE